MASVVETGHGASRAGFWAGFGLLVGFEIMASEVRIPSVLEPDREW
jgi:hypothetical protein